MSLATREFNYADQLRFSSVSGDRNPMHLDALKARRTQAGAPVVHGIHLLLWALDSFAGAHSGLPPLRVISGQFNKFVYLGEQVQVELTRQMTSGVRLSLSVDGGSRCRIALEFGEPSEACPLTDESHEPMTVADPLDRTFEQLFADSGRLGFQMTPVEAFALFPSAARWVGPGRIAGLAATTCLVGMVCPGLHSIYSELSLRACFESRPREFLAYRVTATDVRFHSVEQEVAGGGWIGSVKSFVRSGPVEQALMTSLRGIVSPQEFAGSVALIVGGSRGLGELTAKLIATGYGRTVITWQSGKDDAERIAQEIRSAGGSCETLAYDARKPAGEQLASLSDVPTHAYYFATPAIFRAQSTIFAAARLKEFLAVYVDGFWQLAQALRERRPGISIFYPSSVAVTERPKGMTEYSMAKAAGEILCSDLNNALTPLHITVSRLPRLPTDQTTSVTEATAADPVRIMLPIIREVQSWPR
jgi:NADP-dependent 3-hydroxy acid dehydrogenase YdfG